MSTASGGEGIYVGLPAARCLLGEARRVLHVQVARLCAEAALRASDPLLVVEPQAPPLVALR
eukprot:CAMPEP_0174741230 /NCGR_PEP_ID=MMETSP1094-20130205/75734_1 /TAXON_ID=156173 /ORGANISM="Chrysochromulina brevifilum, Strain UTEX LB 985" /LENGTH=61 /DNA_ID=CAMNT_0015945075 /DNA_START=284 /DNA_END=466 /DNA_ORIENTATION=-